MHQGYLTQEAFTPTGGSASVLSFGYDGHTPSSLPTDPTAGPGNPTLMRGNSHAFNADNGDTGNTFDGNGNPTTYGGNSLAFDAENRMTAYGSSLTNGYDGDDGLRAWKQNSGGTRTYFLYDSGDQPVCELNSSGSVTATNTWGPTGLLSRNVGGTGAGSVFYAFDPSGNLAQRMDTEANVLASVRFDAFGNKSGTDSAPDPYSGFGGEAGYYTDAETGLELLGHRYYDPASGRFLNRDPIGYNGGINLYGYVGNSPANWGDPSGTFRRFPIGSLPGIIEDAAGGIVTGGLKLLGGAIGMAGLPGMPLNPTRMGDDSMPPPPYSVTHSGTQTGGGGGGIGGGGGATVAGAGDDDCGSGPRRVRHYTNRPSQRNIKQTKIIQPTLRPGQEGVHVVDAGSNAGLGDLVGASGTGYWVEIDMYPSDNPIDTSWWNNNYNIPTWRIPTNTDFDISGRNPSFGPWWRF